jgi:uncharacterized protein YbjT (DUF2867 family)
MNKKILFTGGNGLLGRKLTPRLQGAGYRVRVSSRQPRPSNAADDIEWVQAKLGAEYGWADAVSGVDAVVHAASAPFQRGVDVKGTQYMLATAGEAGVGHITYISIVGADKPSWFYFKEKYLCEQGSNPLPGSNFNSGHDKKLPNPTPTYTYESGRSGTIHLRPAYNLLQPTSYA